MSMNGNFAALPARQLEKLLADPSEIEPFLYPDTEEGHPENYLEVDKAWHALHYMLTGESWGVVGTIGQAVLGGQEIGEDIGYGPARYLTPEQVQEIAAEFEKLPEEEFAKRYDGKAMDTAEIYPEIWGRDGDDGLDYVLSFYEDLRQFYFDAAKRGDAALLYLT